MYSSASSISGERQPALFLLVRIAADVVGDQAGHFFAAFAERRQAQADDIQAVEEIRTEGPFRNQLFEVGVGGRGRPDVDLDRLDSPSGWTSWVSRKRSSVGWTSSGISAISSS